MSACSILEKNVLNDPNDLWEIVESRGDEGGALNECYLIVICEKAENPYLYVQYGYNIVNLMGFHDKWRVIASLFHPVRVDSSPRFSGRTRSFPDGSE